MKKNKKVNVSYTKETQKSRLALKKVKEETGKRDGKAIRRTKRSSRKGEKRGTSIVDQVKELALKLQRLLRR